MLTALKVAEKANSGDVILTMFLTQRSETGTRSLPRSGATNEEEKDFRSTDTFWNSK